MILCVIEALGLTNIYLNQLLLFGIGSYGKMYVWGIGDPYSLPHYYEAPPGRKPSGTIRSVHFK